jgi:signal transduction histidine kinase
MQNLSKVHLAYLDGVHDDCGHLIDSLPVGISFVEIPSGEILTNNAAGQQLTGGTFPRDLDSHPDSPFYATDKGGKRLSPSEAPHRRVARGEHLAELDLTWHWPGGKVSLLLHSSPLSAGIGILTFQEINKNLQHIERLTKERQARERFVVTLSHDLCNPLSAAKMAAQMAVRALQSQVPATSQLEKLLSRNLHALSRMETMLSNLLDANRIQAGQSLMLHRQRLNLLQMARDVVTHTEGLNCERVQVSGEDVFGLWDKEGMQRVLENLIHNAIKYGGDHGLITLKVSEHDNQAILSVHNWGIAISPEDQQNIFEPFERVSSTSARTKRGWGLGLTIVRDLVQAHGGQVTVNSSADKGTEFLVRMPVG